MNTSRSGRVLPFGFGGSPAQFAEEFEVHTLRRPLAGVESQVYAPAATGESAAAERLRSQVKRIAPYYRTALLTGPQGTGKDGVARMLHALSPCSEGEFVACEASALAEAMLREDGRALIEAVGRSAVGGTLFLDDIGEVPAALQGTLLRIWTAPSRGRIRVVASTHRDLRTMSITGQFRPELAQRLMGVEVAVTPLSERAEDLVTVIGEVLRKVGGDRNLMLAPAAFEALRAHTWPGDIAEIDRVLSAAMRMAEASDLLEAGHLPQLVPVEAEEPEGSMERLDAIVQQHVLGVLTRCGGNKLRAAEVLGISRSTLYRMLESHLGEGFGED